MYTIKPIKAFIDNYIWCIHNNKNALVVDPGDASNVKTYLDENKLTLNVILITHHHNDHIDGISELKILYPNVKIYSNISRVATSLIKDKDLLKIDSLNLTFEVIELPGHTLSHIAFYGNKMLFCGDTLFSAGCGRIFEGTYQQMYQSLMKIRSLDEEIKIYPAHEYTLKNIEFALTIEPNNYHLKNRYGECLSMKKKNLPTLPTKLQIEKLTNPFLRCDMLQLKNNIGMIDKSPEEVFMYIRELRNKF